MTFAARGLLFAVLADGPTDSALLPILRWAPRQADPDVVLRQPVFQVRNPAGAPIPDAVRKLIENHGPDLVFVHRDAEGALQEVRLLGIPRHELVVPVVPVRMTEAWLLVDEQAIRRASGNPNGKEPLSLPPVGRLEREPDPKRLLLDLLRTASGLHGRRLKRFRSVPALRRVADFIADFSALRGLPAFRRFESDLRATYPRTRAIGRSKAGAFNT